MKKYDELTKTKQKVDGSDIERKTKLNHLAASMDITHQNVAGETFLFFLDLITGSRTVFFKKIFLLPFWS